MGDPMLAKTSCMFEYLLNPICKSPQTHLSDFIGKLHDNYRVAIGEMLKLVYLVL